MSVFEEILNLDNSVFENQDIFNIDYFPETIYCRDKELKSILINIKPLLNNNKTLNTIIIGESGTGKTTVIKHALIEIEKFTDIKTCYLNCNIQDTARKCYSQMFKVIFGNKPKNNLSTEVIQEEIMEKLEEESFILVMDDMDHLQSQDTNKLLNELLRANEFYHSNMAIILIMNNISFKYSLEKKAQNVLQCHEIEFKKYTTDEMYRILKHRCDLGFKKGVISDEQIWKISENAASYTDLRWGLKTLNVLGQKLERENKDKIEDSDLNKVLLFSQK